VTFSNIKGFTLIELIIVVIIIGILSAIGGPIMSRTVAKAKKAEALAALGTIRTAERLYSVEKGDYPATIDAVAAAGFMNLSDLDGKYFMNTAYDLVNVAGTGPTARCNVNNSADLVVHGANITLTWDGNFTGN
jgi:prepilin-type N-terminal cleavage/methylation domain-containing protein